MYEQSGVLRGASPSDGELHLSPQGCAIALYMVAQNGHIATMDQLISAGAYFKMKAEVLHGCHSA